MAQVLRKAVQVHDPELHPGGGPLVTIPARTPIGEIPDRLLEQLCSEHFTESE